MMNTIRHGTNSIILAMLMTACGQDGPGPSARATVPLAPTVTDSGGITIYEQPGDALEHAPSILVDPEPLARFGGGVEDLKNDVTGLDDLSVLSDGRLVGFDYSRSVVVILDPADGSRVEYGGPGEGPEEFGRTVKISGVVNDTVFVSDGSNARLAVVLPDSGIIGTIPTRGFRAYVFGRTATGQFLGDGSALGDLSMEPGYAYRMPMQVVRSKLDGNPPDTLFSYEGYPYVMQNIKLGGQIRLVSMILRFTNSPSVLQWGEYVVVAPSNRWEFMLHNFDGELTSIIRLDKELLPPTESQVTADIEAGIARRIAAAAEPLADSVLQRSREESEQRAVAPVIPAYTIPVVTADNILWAPDYRLLDSSGWGATAFNLAGEIVGRIESDSGKAPVAFGSDRVVFRTEDDNGLATLAVHRLFTPRK